MRESRGGHLHCCLSLGVFFAESCDLWILFGVRWPGIAFFSFGLRYGFETHLVFSQREYQQLAALVDHSG